MPPADVHRLSHSPTDYVYRSQWSEAHSGNDIVVSGGGLSAAMGPGTGAPDFSARMEDPLPAGRVSEWTVHLGERWGSGFGAYLAVLVSLRQCSTAK